MDAPTATLLAAAIAGTVALVTTIVSYLNIRRQLLLTREEAERSRRHARSVAAGQRVETAAAELWAALYQMQKEGRLTRDTEVQIVKAMMWMPTEMRSTIADLLLAASSGPSQEAQRLTAQTQGNLLKLIQTEYREDRE